MKNPIKWVSFFSRTGKELTVLASSLNRYPDVLVTNKPEEDVKKELLNNCKVLLPALRSALDIEDSKAQTLITLNGYLRILPKSFIEQFDHIYNGHPGLITEYPVLKGKDPQEKAFRLKLTHSGSVIHRVTPEVDEGEIVASEKISITEMNLNQVYDELAVSSLSLWTNFIRHTFPEIGSINNFIKK
jgi:methionyl-tRNA formyltransferase